MLFAIPYGLDSRFKKFITTCVSLCDQIAETYAFLPREAVTRFLMSCSDCQKRMHVTSAEETHSNASCESSYKPEPSIEDPPIIDFSVPITQTYLNHMKQKGMAMDTGVTDEVIHKIHKIRDSHMSILCPQFLLPPLVA